MGNSLKQPINIWDTASCEPKVEIARMRAMRACLKYTIAVLRMPNPADENPELIPGELREAKSLVRLITKWLYWTVPQFFKQSSELSRPE
jgi:hypothetical protein